MWKCTFQLHRLGHNGGDTHKRFSSSLQSHKPGPPPSGRQHRIQKSAYQKHHSSHEALLCLVKAGRKRGDKGQLLSILYQCDGAGSLQRTAMFPWQLCVCADAFSTLSPCSFQTVFLCCGLSRMYSPSYTDHCVKKTQRLTFFGGEVCWVGGGKSWSSILSQIANKKQEEKGSVRENTLDGEKAEHIQCLEIGGWDTMAFLKWCFAALPLCPLLGFVTVPEPGVNILF